MAKRKKKSRRPKMLTKIINVGILALAFSWVINWAISSRDPKLLIHRATAGLSEGSFSTSALMEFYGPMIGAIVLKKAISMVRKTARV